jgi:arginine N-succinyltransferase
MLEETETGDVDGIGSVKAAVGLNRPFFSFRVVTNTQSSPSLGIKLEQKTLVLVNECTGWSEVGSLFLKADRRKGGAGRLLSQSRYMLIGAEPDLFADTVLAELRGVFTPDGACPFWDHVAHKFFPLDFDEADRMTGSTDKQFILDLAPRHPIYMDLLPEPARADKAEDDGRTNRAFPAINRVRGQFSGILRQQAVEKCLQATAAVLQ